MRLKASTVLISCVVASSLGNQFGSGNFISSIVLSLVCLELDFWCLSSDKIPLLDLCPFV